MTQAIRDLLSSKKFLAALVAILVQLGARYGLELDQDQIMGLISPLLAFIVGQGIADFGKNRAPSTSTSSSVVIDRPAPPLPPGGDA